MATITDILSNPEKIENGKGENYFVRHGEIEKLIEQELQNWENLHEELEKLKNQKS